jgi:peptidase E
MKTRDQKRIRENLAKTLEADAAHDAKMEVIAKRGGKTLKAMRAMEMRNKDAFITENVREGDYT